LAQTSLALPATPEAVLMAIDRVRGPARLG
jgi:xanthine dehydrogenase molybdopterin-binding subunit B